MTRKIIIIAIVMLATLIIIGTASAYSVTILPEDGDNVASDGTITNVYVGASAYDSVGLAALYTDWPASSTYDVVITEDATGDVVWEKKSSDVNPPATFSGTKQINVGWVPVSGDNDKFFTITANGQTGVRIKTASVPIDPAVPELGTSILTATGLIGLIGFVRSRRKD